MQDQFVTHPIAQKFKELGFNEPCLTHFFDGEIVLELCKLNYPTYNKGSNMPTAPLWQQAIAWIKQNTKVAVQERLDGWYVVRKNTGFEVNNNPLILEQAILLALKD